MGASTQRERSIDGKRVLVTGAGSGIGKAAALAFAAKHAEVLCADVKGEAARLTAKACEEAGAIGAAGYDIDVADRAAMGDFADDVHTDGGPVDVLVNNAGVGATGRFLDMEIEDWDWLLGINLMGVVHGCHFFGRAMLERGSGHVLNTSSALAFMHRATEPSYVTSKAGVLALSRCLRADWGPHGVGVSAICPGVIATPIIGGTRFRGDRADEKSIEEVRRLFTKGHPPEKVAAAMLDAVARNRPVVPVGFEAWLGVVANRFLPSRAADVINRARLGAV